MHSFPFFHWIQFCSGYFRQGLFSFGGQKKWWSSHSVYPPPPLLSALWLRLLAKLQKEGGLARSQFLEGGCWERGADFFGRFAVFAQKIN